MVGSVGMVRSTSRPSSLVIQEALNLLSALGGGTPAVKKLLEEMKSVQTHNEEVLQSAKDAVVIANERERQIAKEEADLVGNIREAEALYNARLLEIINSEEKLQRREEEANIRIVEEDEHMSIREGELRRDQEEHSESLHTGRAEFIERERVLKEDRKDLKELESSIEGREEEIKSDRIVLGDLRDSLDKRKSELDERDARVRTAMENVD